MAHLTKDPANAARWVVVYPAYIDSSLSTAEGRKLPTDLVRLCSLPALF